jgi:hypothetical protein
VKIYSNTVPNKKVSANQGKQGFADNNYFKNLNFKGGIPNNLEKELPKVTVAIKAFGEDFGKSAGEHFERIINKAKGSGLEISTDGTVNFTKEPSFLKRALDILLYPIKDMPIDLVNGAINGLKKISWFKNSTWLSDLSAKPFFQKLQKRKEAVENKSNVAAIQHYFELLKEGEEGDYKRFVEGHKRLAPLMPTYNSETERSLNRLVTGLIPAFFLANDAYNLSTYMNNNKDVAKKEKKRRFNQEIVRILTTTAATFSVMSLFAKQCNKNMNLATSLTLGVVLVSEVLGRLIAGNPILPVNAQKAKEYAQKRQEIKQNNTSDSAKQTGNTENKTTKKGFLTLSNVLKVLGGLIVFGFAIEKVSNIKTVKAKLEEFSKHYKGLFTEKYTIKRNEFNDLMDKLNKTGFNKIADFYKKIVEKQQGEYITIGSTKNKPKYILIHQILTFPVRFTWDVLMLPYKKLAKPLIKINNEAKNEELPKRIELIQNGIQFLQKIKDDLNPEFKEKFNQALVSSFDNLTKSNYKNSELSVVVKTAQSAFTSGFLIADNYNMVMIDSQGKDKDLAEQKAKERAMQRGARPTYEALILKMVNDIFEGPYNASLLAALGIAGGLRIITEMVERKAVGLPLGESTQDEIKENEKIHMSATGIKGSYFRTMAKLAGKKSFAEKQKNDKNS